MVILKLSRAALLFPVAIEVNYGEEAGARDEYDSRRWGAGFVVALSRRWPQPEREYRAWADLALGAVQVVQVGDGLWVANMCSQHGVGHGPDGTPPIRYRHLMRCLEQVAAFARTAGATVVGPRFGAGLAGGRWELIEPILVEACADVPVTIYDLEVT